jgi:hypothetical protein
MRFPVFRQIVSMASVTLPVAGTLTNYDPLIAEGYAGETGSDSAAEGCLAFFTHVTIGEHGLTALRCCSLPVAARRRTDVNAITTHGRTRE